MLRVGVRCPRRKLAYLVPGTSVEQFGYRGASEHIVSHGQLGLRRITNEVAEADSKQPHLENALTVIRRETGELAVRSSDGVPSVITAVLHDSMSSIEQDFVTKADLGQMVHEVALPRLREELQSRQELHVSSLQRELENLRNDLQKLRSSHRYELDKLAAGQRLDLNLERGHVRELLAMQQEEREAFSRRLDEEVADLRTRIKANKVYVINSCIATVITVTALAFGLLRLVL